jgi:protein SCO1
MATESAPACWRELPGTRACDPKTSSAFRDTARLSGRLRRPSRPGKLSIALAVLLAFVAAAVSTSHATPAARLPIIGPAPAFSLDSARGSRVKLADLRGKVLAVTFIFTTCTDSCPLLTAKLAEVGRALGADFGPRIAFVAISVDPLNDTPERLRIYASAHRADSKGWHFLTGAPGDVDRVVRGYGAYAKKNDSGSVDHLFLTSLVDRSGRLRVQYLGTRFDPAEMQRDLQALLRE